MFGASSAAAAALLLLTRGDVADEIR
jgi:hypothetical protein